MQRPGLALLLVVIACNPGGATSGSTGTTTEASTTLATTTSTSTITPTSTSTASDPSEGATSTGTTSSTSTSTSTTSTSTGELTTTTGAATSSTTGGLTRCPAVAVPVEVATAADPAITETSGLVHSRSQPGVFWLHNDSGDDPRFFAIDGAGAMLGVFNVVGADADDWEDMSSGPGPSPGEWLYFGDIGDNPEVRPTVTVYRVPEPDAAAANGGEVDVDGAEAIELAYPDGPHNAETLLVDPQTGGLVIVAKGDPTRIFHIPGPVAPGGPQTLEEIAPIDFPATIATGGDISPLGDFIAVRTYGEAFLWLRGPGTTLADAFAGAPCTIPLAVEPQGESLAIAGDGSGYYTLSEGQEQPLWWFSFE